MNRRSWRYLRGDEYLLGFDPDDMRGLAGWQTTPWHQEFIALTQQAGR